MSHRPRDYVFPPAVRFGALLVVTAFAGWLFVRLISGGAWRLDRICVLLIIVGTMLSNWVRYLREWRAGE